MSDFHRVLARLYNTPLLISEEKLDIISSEVTLKLLAGVALSKNVATPTDKPTPTSSDSIAIIKVFDSLVSKGGAGESGYTSYEDITSQIKSAISMGASKIGFYIDSPGGEAFGNFPLAHLISSLPSMGIETFSFTDGAMHSAAYAIGSAAQRIYATASSSVGSIGTLITLVDKTKAIEEAGYKYTILRSKPEKALGSPIEGYSQEALAKYQAILEEMDSLFNKTVSSQRPILSEENIIAMKGASFMATKGLELNLIDSIVASFDEVLSIESSLTQLKRGNTMTLEEIKTQLAAKEQELATMQAQVTGLVAKAITDERVRCVEILSAASTLKISQEQAIKRINAGSSKEDSLEIFTAIAEAVGAVNAIDTSGSSTPAGISVNEVIGSKEKVTIEGVGELTASEILTAAKASVKGVK